MYRKTTLESPQLKFEFAMPFGGELNPENRWVKKKELFPWTYIEELYEATLSGSDGGCPALPSSVAFGALYIQEFLGLTDRETVAQITENPYMQYFLGHKTYSPEEPFDHTMLVMFRKRFSEEMLAKINEQTVSKALGLSENEDEDDANNNEASSDNPHDPSAKDNRSFEEKSEENNGQLLVDATCTPADIPYPTDVSLLNEAREQSEKIIDLLHAPYVGSHKKPRTYRQRARKEYLYFSKQRKPNIKKIRKALRKQLGYLRRNLATITHMAVSLETGLRGLSKRYYKLLLVINEVYRQQQYMYANKIHSVDNRIVNIYQPHVRPIVRGKAGKPVEFGAKISISLINGYSFVEHLSWEAYNESCDLESQIERYKKRYGYYPKAVQADKIYRTRANRKYCYGKGIRLSGPPLGRRPKETDENKESLKALKKQQQQDERDRQAVEGKFGQGKRRFSLGHIMAKLAVTSEAVIMISFVVINIEKIYRDLLFVLFSSCRKRIKTLYTPLRWLVSGEICWPIDFSGLHFHSERGCCAA